jgi:hypothetical protein
VRSRWLEALEVKSVDGFQVGGSLGGWAGCRGSMGSVCLLSVAGWWSSWHNTCRPKGSVL